MISEKIVMASVSEPGRNCNGLATNSKMEMGRSHLFISNHNSKKRRWTRSRSWFCFGTTGSSRTGERRCIAHGCLLHVSDV
jgi:hypothetical protein